MFIRYNNNQIDKECVKLGYFVMLIIGLIIGFVVRTHMGKVQSIGTLLVDKSMTDDGQYLLLELDEYAETILYNHKYAKVRIQLIQARRATR